MKYILATILLISQFMFSQTYNYKYANKIENNLVVKSSECNVLEVKIINKVLIVSVDADGIPSYKFKVSITGESDTIYNGIKCKLYLGVRETLFSKENLKIFIFKDECLIINEKNRGYYLTQISKK